MSMLNDGIKLASDRSPSDIKIVSKYHSSFHYQQYLSLYLLMQQEYIFLACSNETFPEQVYDITLTARNKLSYFYLYVPGVPA